MINIRFRRKKLLQGLSIVPMFLLMSIGGCSGKANMVIAPDNLFLESDLSASGGDSSKPSKEEFFEHVLKIIQTVKASDDDCGIFNNTNIKDGEVYSKTDSNGGSYTRQIEKNAVEIMSNKTTNPSSEKTGSDNNTAIVYEFKNYTGDLQMSDGTILLMSGRIIGKDWDQEKGTMRLRGRLTLEGIGLVASTIDFYSVGIDNGPTGSKCGSRESIIPVKLSPNNMIQVSYRGRGDMQSMRLSVKETKNETVQKWMQKLIKFE